MGCTLLSVKTLLFHAKPIIFACNIDFFVTSNLPSSACAISEILPEKQFPLFCVCIALCINSILNLRHFYGHTFSSLWSA